MVRRAPRLALPGLKVLRVLILVLPLVLPLVRPVEVLLVLVA
jgi:hypothetical protein